MINRVKPVFTCSLILVLSIVGYSSSVFAHFQVLYTPEMALTRGKATQFTMVFTHPVHGGPHMDMEPPDQFYVDEDHVDLTIDDCYKHFIPAI